jgi:hypothetical protein
MTPYAPNITSLPVVRVKHSKERYDWMDHDDHRSYYYTDSGTVELKRHSVSTWVEGIYTPTYYWVWELHHFIQGERGRYQYWSADGWEDKGKAFQAGIEALFNLAKHGIAPNEGYTHQGVSTKMRWHFFQEMGWQGPVSPHADEFPF